MVNKVEDYDWKRNDDGTISCALENIPNIKSLLGQKGQGFCLAKFTQVTLHLGSGHVHSCHHPKVHKIPLEELEDNPAALFNTKHLKQARQEMLNNQKPSECDYCWRIEDKGNNSDRMFKSLEGWALENHDQISQLSGQEDIKPTYLEVSFGNACNLQCAYCGPEFSTKWVEDLKSKGPIVISDGPGKEQWAQGWQDLDNIAIPNREHNPYIEAFWKWFPEIYPGLKHYRITGGEPLLNKNTIKSLDYILENPKEDLSLSINTNLSVPDHLWYNFLEKLIEIEKTTNFKKITIFTSFEGWDCKASYARHGLEFEKLIARFEELLQKTNVRCVVMATYNIFAVTSFKKVLEWVLELKKKYNFNPQRTNLLNKTGYDFRTNPSEPNPNGFRVGIDIPYLRSPEWLDAQYCSNDLFEEYMYETFEFLNSNICLTGMTNHLGFEPYEVNKFERIFMNRAFFLRKFEEKKRYDVIRNRAKFYDYVNRLDERRGTNFLEVFPEMRDFYRICESAKKEYA